MHSAARQAVAAFLISAGFLYAQQPDSFQANLRTGVQLDLDGQYADARRHFTKAIESASTAQEKARALRSMAISWAFENNCKEAAQYEGQVYESALAAQDFYAAGEAADELARICIEAGGLDDAYKWYQ